MAITAWYLNNDDDGSDDQRLPHQFEPNRPVSLDELAKLGLGYCVLNQETMTNDPQFQKLVEERGYDYRFVVARL